MALDASAFDASPGSGRATYQVENLAMPDYHDIVNSIGPNPKSVPGHVSFEVTWGGRGDRQNIKDATFGFAGEFVTGTATISFTVSDDGSGTTYTADAAGQATGLPPSVGHERNGVFF